MNFLFKQLNTVFVYLAAAGALVVSSAAAQDDGSGGVYARVGGGVSFVSDWDQDVTFNPNLGGAAPCPRGVICPPILWAIVDRQSLNIGEGLVASAALGFDFSNVRTELEYRYASADIEDKVVSFSAAPGVTPPPPDTRVPLADSIGAHFVLANFYFDFRNSSRFTPFIGAGVGGASVRNDDGDLAAVLAYQGRAGVSFAVSKSFYLDGEYVYLRTNELTFGPDIKDLMTSPAIPNISGDRYASSSVMVSLRKHF